MDNHTFASRTPAWPPRSAPRLFVPGPLAAGAGVTIEGPQAHYLGRVMRLGVGDAVILCDDLTGEWVATVADVGKRAVSLTVDARLRGREAVPDLTLCACLLKKDRFDLVLEKATELGVARIQPVIARRCVADSLNLDRARALVTEAAEQCARTALPEVLAPVKLGALLAGWPGERALFFADEAAAHPDGGAPTMPAAEAFRSGGDLAAILIGPEGGFEDGERAAIRAVAAARAVSLGPRILRGETAAVAALALWMGMAGDWQL